jgi:hypothetical protein
LKVWFATFAVGLAVFQVFTALALLWATSSVWFWSEFEFPGF